MPRITINGLGIDYELLGKEGAPAVAITPGGRFTMQSPGIRELGEALVAGGRRALIWNRPNCGTSDFTLDGDSESGINGRTLAAMIRELKLGPTALAAGSAGARVSMIAAAAAPDLISHLIMWWISGGPISLMALATYYYGDAAHAIGLGGMAAVAKERGWMELMEQNPKAREQILAMDPEKFIEAMQRWAKGFRPSDDSPIPGMKPADFLALKMPVLIFRSGKSDVAHPRATSEEVARLIPQSKIIDPPWPDEEWNERRLAVGTGKEKGLFIHWPRLAPLILDFIKQN